MRPVELNSIVLIRGKTVCLYGMTGQGTKFLDSYSREEALVIGNELIEAALKIQRKERRRGEVRPMPGEACRNPACGQPAGNGQLYCSHPCYVTHRWRSQSEAQPQ